MNNLLKYYADMVIDLTSSNTYSHGKFQMPLSQYLLKYLNKQDSCQNSNETLYFFGNNYDSILYKDVLESYNYPPCRNCIEAGALSIGIGGYQSGVAFHFHGPGFSEVLVGKKSWYLFDPSVNIPGFSPNSSISSWASASLPALISEASAGFFYCTIEPGEVLYFPNKWMHGTLNQEAYNFFVSLFLDIQLLHQDFESGYTQF